MARSKTPKPLLTLGDVKYLSLGDDYFFGGVVSPRAGGGVASAKHLYLEAGKKFYKQVAAAIQAKVPHFTSKITSNAGGDAVAGDVSMGGWMFQRAIYSSLVYEPNEQFARLFWRVGTGAFATDGVNLWVETSGTSSEEVAAMILKGMERMVGTEKFAQG